MQIILVSRRHRVPRKLDLDCRKTRWRLIAAAALVMILCMSLAVSLTLAVASPQARVLGQLKQLKQTVSRQNTQLAEVRRDAQRDLDALAVKLGQLEAQSTRLNALGQRLTEVGKLDKSEFDFDQPPPLGGAEDPAGRAYALSLTLNDGIGHLAQRFDSQQAQLAALQSLLLDARIESSLRPTGMPVQGYISSYFGSRTDPFNGHGEFHRGIDIAAALGTPVHAVAEGLVSFAGVRSGYGNVIEVDHGNGYMTRYAHNSSLVAHVGQRVRVGDVLSLAGSTGRSTGSHVHFEVWLHDRVVNPLTYAQSRR